MKTKEIDEAKIKAQSIIWCDNSLEEKETMMNNLLSTLRQSVLEEVREKMPKYKDTSNLFRGGSKDWVESWNFGFDKAIEEVTSLINKLEEEGK